MPIDPPRGLWETALAFLPVALVAVGGVVGGVFGGGSRPSSTSRSSRSDLRTPMRVVAMLAVTLVAADRLVRRRTHDPRCRSTPSPTYAAGECVDGIGTGSTIDATTIRTVACANPHQGEVVGVHDLAAGDGAPFPGSRRRSRRPRATDARCSVASYIVHRPSTSRASEIAFTSTASEDTWGQR